jgi:uncharacterized protein with von Willebrand factor type A (vWA) domain
MAGNLLAYLVRFARALRQQGVLVTPEQVTALARALETLPSLDRETFRLAARATLVCRQEDLEPFERAFALFFGLGEEAHPLRLERTQSALRPRRPLMAQAPLLPRGAP